MEKNILIILFCMFLVFSPLVGAYLSDSTDGSVNSQFDNNGNIVREDYADGTYAIFEYAEVGDNTLISKTENYDTQGIEDNMISYSYYQNGNSIGEPQKITQTYYDGGLNVVESKEYTYYSSQDIYTEHEMPSNLWTTYSKYVNHKPGHKEVAYPNGDVYVYDFTYDQNDALLGYTLKIKNLPNNEGDSEQYTLNSQGLIDQTNYGDTYKLTQYSQLFGIIEWVCEWQLFNGKYKLEKCQSYFGLSFSGLKKLFSLVNGGNSQGLTPDQIASTFELWNEVNANT